MIFRQLFASWGARHEPAESCSGRLAGFLNQLRVVAPSAFGKWYRTGYSRGEALKKPFSPSSEKDLRSLFDEGKRGRKFENLGFSVDLWNGADGIEASHLLVTCGLYARVPGLRNRVQLTMPQSVLANEQQTKATLEAAVRSWKPTWAAVHTPEVDVPLDLDEPPIDWMVFVANARVVAPALPSPATVETIEPFGILVTVADGVDKPLSEQSATARRIGEYLRRARIGH